MAQNLVRVDALKPGATVLGTGASGDFEDGPRVLVSITPAPEHSRRTAAYHLRWDSETANVYYGDTLVDVATLGGAR